MDWLFWPAVIFFGMVFLSACLNQKSAWVKLWQIAMGLIMLVLALLWEPFWWPVRLAQEDTEYAGLFWGYLMYGIIMIALLCPWIREDT